MSAARRTSAGGAGADAVTVCEGAWFSGPKSFFWAWNTGRRGIEMAVVSFQAMEEACDNAAVTSVWWERWLPEDDSSKR
jgi:hypothetical protein